MTTATTHQLLLPGQAAAPEGPVDMSPMYAMHHAFRRDLRDFAAAVTATPLHDEGTWRRLDERWATFCHELHNHHSKEDELVWPLLLEAVRAAGDTESEHVLEEMEAEHDQIDPLLASTTEAFAAQRTRPDEDVRGRLHGLLTSFLQVLDQHLRHEEAEAMVVLQRYVDPTEWAVLERTKLNKGMTLRDAAFLVPWIFKGLSDRDAATLRAKLPPPLKVVDVVSRRGFARREAATFRHLA
ncbi:MAG: hemerythrin domain-containing protein [Aeromicrobium erythreum]